VLALLNNEIVGRLSVPVTAKLVPAARVPTFVQVVPSVLASQLSVEKPVAVF
jgi:hypothetical protein